VTGEVEKSADLGSIESADTVDGSSVTGSVLEEADGYRFSGDLSTLVVDGDSNIAFEDNDE